MASRDTLGPAGLAGSAKDRHVTPLQGGTALLCISPSCTPLTLSNPLHPAGGIAGVLVLLTLGFMASNGLL